MLAELKREFRETRRAVRRAARDQSSRPTREPLPFGVSWLRRFLPAYVKDAPSKLHEDLAADLADFHATRGRKHCYIAPRGGAKTTWLSKAYPLWAVCEEVEPFVLLLAETGEQAEVYLSAIKDELAGNAELAAYYPSATGIGPVWRSDRIELRNGRVIAAKGSGGRILGATAGAHRPTLVVGDDMNQRADAYSPTLRRRKNDWFLRDVMNAGEPRTNYLAAGTPIHREAIVCELKRNGGWTTRSYKSVARWPDRMDLWAEWEKKVANLADPERLATARGFYEANAAAMEAGSSVLWPAREPLYALMLLRATLGPAAFNSEKQDEPGTDGATEWPSSYFDDPRLFFDRWPAGLSLSLQALDPSKGLHATPGDYQAHGRLGLAADGTLYIEADLRREPITDCVERAIELYVGWGSSELIAESNNTMGLLAPEFERNLNDRAKAHRPALCNYAEVYHTDPKLARIRCVGGYLGRGQIRVKDTPGGRLLVEQWRDAPNGEFDDGPDMVATLIRRAEQLVNGGAA